MFGENDYPRGRPARTWLQDILEAKDAHLVSCYRRHNTETTGENWSIQRPTIRTDDGLKEEEERFYENCLQPGFNPDLTTELTVLPSP